MIQHMFADQSERKLLNFLIPTHLMSFHCKFQAFDTRNALFTGDLRTTRFPNFVGPCPVRGALRSTGNFRVEKFKNCDLDGNSKDWTRKGRKFVQWSEWTGSQNLS